MQLTFHFLELLVEHNYIVVFLLQSLLQTHILFFVEIDSVFQFKFYLNFLFLMLIDKFSLSTITNLELTFQSTQSFNILYSFILDFGLILLYDNFYFIFTESNLFILSISNGISLMPCFNQLGLKSLYFSMKLLILSP